MVAQAGGECVADPNERDSSQFNGLGVHLGNLARLSNAQSRSLSAENPTGARGRGGMAPRAPARSTRVN